MGLIGNLANKGTLLIVLAVGMLCLQCASTARGGSKKCSVNADCSRGFFCDHGECSDNLRVDDSNQSKLVPQGPLGQPPTQASVQNPMFGESQACKITSECASGQFCNEKGSCAKPGQVVQ